MRRCLVSHYCNARSYTPWAMGNEHHILARGNTHLSFSVPSSELPALPSIRSERRSATAGSYHDDDGDAGGMMGEETPSIDPHDD